MERINRRRLMRVAVGAVVVASTMVERKLGVRAGEPYADEAQYLRHLFLEHRQQEEVTLAAQDDGGAYGDLKMPSSLLFEPAGTGKYKLLVPSLVRGGWGEKNLPYGSVAVNLSVGVEPPKVFGERPRWPAEILRSPVFKGPSDRPMVGLTFDDGYFGREEILSTIVAQKVEATFFIIGSVISANRSFVKRATESGVIDWGNHTYTHGNLTGMSVAQINGELADTESVLADASGATTIPIMRPPGGSRNSATIEAAASRSFRTFLWNVSGDAGSYTPDQLVSLYLGQIDKMQNPWGSILLMHFRTATAQALPEIIRGLKTRGLQPVSLGRLYEGGRV